MLPGLLIYTDTDVLSTGHGKALYLHTCANEKGWTQVLMLSGCQKHPLEILAGSLPGLGRGRLHVADIHKHTSTSFRVYDFTPLIPYYSISMVR